MEDDRQSFCFMHKAILQLTPNGMSKGYPLFIDFYQIIAHFSGHIEGLFRIRISGSQQIAMMRKLAPDATALKKIFEGNAKKVMKV
jgi:hypothetical protein